LAGGGAGKSVKVFQIYQSGGPTLTNADAAKFARYDMFSFNRNRFYQMTPNTYAAVRALNPDVIIFNYQQGPDTWTDQDGSNILNVNNIVRYNNTYGHSMGNLNTDNPDLFLLNSSGQRIHTYYKSNRYFLDFGSSRFQAYWLEATEHDVVDQEWRPDGILIDNTLPRYGDYIGELPAKYPTDTQWMPAMHSYVAALSARLHQRWIKTWINSGDIVSANGYTWHIDMDADPNHPDFFAEEGAFVHSWGSVPFTFYDETKWKRQVDLMWRFRTQASPCSATAG
jgi:hypothetical protein